MQMSKHLLQIDISNSKYETQEDLIKIKFQNDEYFQINFPKFFLQSKYIRDKYKYCEALESIQIEIDKIKKEIHINDTCLKYFIKLIEDEKINIPIELYKDIYALSEYFCIPKITTVLDNVYKESLLNDLEFTIQILLDSENSTSTFKTKLTSKIENFLKGRINECIVNAKFRELPVSTIFRIIEISKEEIEQNLLIDFILESVENRFMIFKFIELDKMSEDKVYEMIEILEKQEECFRKIYFEYIPFNLSFIKNMKHKFDQFLKEMKDTKEKLEETNTKYEETKEKLEETNTKYEETKEKLEETNTKYEETKEKLEETNTKYEETKQELEEIRSENNRIQDEIKATRNENKGCTQSILVCGRDDYNGLGEKPNNIANGHSVIHPPLKLSLDPSSIQSYSVYYEHAVVVMKDGSLKGIGNNSDGRISATLEKNVIDHFTDFCIKDSSCRQLVAISAVCCTCGTLYMFSKSGGNERLLVLCDSSINGGSPVFLDIGNHHPVSLFGGYDHSAAIGSEGEIIFINRDSVIKSPKSPIAAVSLPNSEKVSSVAGCESSVVVLSSKGRVFTSPIESNGVFNFSIVSELSNQEIVSVSGTFRHFLAVNKKGQVFALGLNKYGELGLDEDVKSNSTFTKILSLRGYELRSAYAGCYFSLFETREGKILSCGRNSSGELLFSSVPSKTEYVYSPTETTITNGSSFSIAGYLVSAVFIGSGPPPNTPNMRILQYQ